MDKLTKLEASILFFINDYISTHFYPPTVREVADGCYISVSVAHKYIMKLSRKGFIEITPNTARSIVLKKNKCNL